MPCGWEGNRRSGVALATYISGSPLQAQGLGEGGEHSSMLSCGARLTLPLPGKLYCTVARDKIVTK